MNEHSLKAVIEEIRALLGEAYSFQSTSPRAQENINAALDHLDAIDTSIFSLTPVSRQTFEKWAFEKAGLMTAKDAYGDYVESETAKAWAAVQFFAITASAPKQQAQAGEASQSKTALQDWQAAIEQMTEEAIIQPQPQAVVSKETDVDEQCPTCGEREAFTGSCGTSKDDTRALCRRASLAQPTVAAEQGLNWKQHIHLQPVACEDEPDAHNVIFKVGVQSFVIGCIPHDTKEEAEWFAGQFVKALENVYAAHPAAVQRDEQERDKTLEEIAAFADGLAKLYERKDVGFDVGYAMAAERIANQARALKTNSACGNTAKAGEQEAKPDDWRTFFIVARPGMAPRIGLPIGEVATSLREWYAHNPGAEIYVVNSWGSSAGCQTVENGREILFFADAADQAEAQSKDKP